MKRIRFKIDKHGATTILDAEGYGSTCVAATARLEGRLGTVDESSRASTPNFFADPETQTAQQGLG